MHKKKNKYVSRFYLPPLAQPKIYSTRAYHIPQYPGTAVSYLVPKMHKIALAVNVK